MDTGELYEGPTTPDLEWATWLLSMLVTYVPVISLWLPRTLGMMQVRRALDRAKPGTRRVLLIRRVFLRVSPPAGSKALG